MGLGIFGMTKRAASPLGALGASTIPGTCWDVPGFQDCHARQWEKARTDCGRDAALYFNGDTDACIEAYADQGTYNVCVPQLCPTSTSQVKPSNVGLTWRNSTPNAKVRQLQTAVNVILRAKGLDLIGTDGKLGADTCGAAFYCDENYGSSFFTDYGLSRVCQSTNMPKRNGVPVTNLVMAPTTTHIADNGQVVQTLTETAQLPWGATNADTATLQRELNTHLASNDMLPIPVTGILDAATCGAMKWLRETTGMDYQTSRGANCQAFTAPTHKPVAVATRPAAVPSVTPGGGSALPIGPAASSSKMSAATMVTGGILLAAAAGGYYYAKKKGWVA